jgi:hypothetical protein
MTARLLAKLEDFRLLPIFVVVSMAIGIGIGKALSISDFALTPPIDAIKAIFGGTFTLTVPSAISLGVPIGLFAMMYPAMTNVRLGEVGDAFRSPRQLGVVLLFNYLVAPFVMLGLANVFVSDPELHTGLVLYGLAPCIAMVIIFTFLAKGNTPMALVFVALNSVAQMLLIPVYARLLIGNVNFDVWVVAESVVLYLGLPLLLGVLTRMAVTRRGGEGAAQAGSERALNTWPAVHSDRHVLAQGRPDSRATRHRPGDGDPNDTLLRDDVLRRSLHRVTATLPISGRSRRSLQLDGPRFRDRDRHRHHRVLAHGRAGHCRGPSYRGTRDAGPHVVGNATLPALVRRACRRSRSGRGPARVLSRLMSSPDGNADD